jgi:hypothetical protein
LIVFRIHWRAGVKFIDAVVRKAQVVHFSPRRTRRENAQTFWLTFVIFVFFVVKYHAAQFNRSFSDIRIRKFFINAENIGFVGRKLPEDPLFSGWVWVFRKYTEDCWY